MKRLSGYRNFCNKLWNASRFVLMNTEEKDCGQNGGEMEFSLADRWILAEYNNTVKAYREALDTYRFDIASNILYEFTGTSSVTGILSCPNRPFIKVPMHRNVQRVIP